MATINLGNLTFTHKGDYAGGTAYVKNDVVYYATNGNSYIAKTSTTGNAPTSTAHWDLFVAGASGIWNAGLSLGSAGQIVQVNSGANALEFANAAGGVVSSGTFANGRNFATYSFDNQTSSSSTSFIDVNGSAWNVGAGALTANKTCMIQYSVISYNQDWQHDKIALQYSVDDGSNWLYTNNNSEDVFDVDHELASSANATTRRTAFHIIDFTSGQTPRFRMKCAIYSSSNGLKINYDAGNNGTVKSYYQAWFV
tara:strand:+ start:377 stop:1138 length:762 start_codon:yes stop_codon:yes gene_type:complete